MSASATLARLTDRREPSLSGPEPFVAYLADQTTRALVARFAAARGWPATSVQPGGLAAAARTFAVAEPPAILLLDVSDSGDPVGDFASLAEAVEAGCRIIVVSAGNDARLYRALLARGAADYLVKPFDEALLADAVDRLGRRDTATLPDRKARRIAVTGARGGVGASTVACTLAALFAAEHRLRTTLVDLDLRFGDAALSLGVTCGPGLRECLEFPDRIDDLFLERATVACGERLRVLAAEEPIGDDWRLDPGAFAKLAEQAGRASAMLVVDLPRWYPSLASTFAAVDEIVVVAELTLSAARDTLRLRRLAQAAGGTAKLRIVANNTGRRGIGQVSRGEFEQVAGEHLAACLPAAPDVVAMAASLGRPLPEVARRSALVTACARLAGTLAGAPPRRAGLLLRLLGAGRR